MNKTPQFLLLRIVASIRKRGKYQKTSLRKLACFKNQGAPKSIKFSKKYESFKKIKKYIKLSKSFKKVRKYLKKVRCVENKTNVRKS